MESNDPDALARGSASQIAERQPQSARGWPLYAAFAALALLAGPVHGYLGDYLLGVSPLVYEALGSSLAGVALLALAVTRRQNMLKAQQWLALVALLIPQLCFVPLNHLGHAIPWLPTVGGGTALLLSVAAPLWLSLLGALELFDLRVPRAVAGAAIAGVGAICLVLPTTAYTVAPNQAPALLLQLLLNIAIVASWVYAAPRLAGADTLMVTGGYLLLSAAGATACSIAFQRDAFRAIDWPSAWTLLLAQAAMAASVWWLWFWLLQRITLAAFAMRALAAWAASLLPVFVTLGLLHWRLDAALGIAAAVVVVALRAGVEEEQPTALGLRGT